MLRQKQNFNCLDSLVRNYLSRIKQTPGGGVFPESWVGVCRELPKTLTLFMPKICHFCHPIYDQTKNFIPYLPLRLANLFYKLWGALMFWKSSFFQEAYPIQDESAKTMPSWWPKWPKSPKLIPDTLFMTKTATKPYLLGQYILYLYTPYKGVPTPPPTAGKPFTKNERHAMHALTFINVKVILN